MAKINSNTYVEPGAPTTLNAGRGQVNNSLRSLLTNFKSNAEPTFTNITAAGETIGPLGGMLFRDDSRKALYIYDEENTKRSYSNFTRNGIGYRLEESNASLAANAESYEIGELITVASDNVQQFANSAVWVCISNSTTNGSTAGFLQLANASDLALLRLTSNVGVFRYSAADEPNPTTQNVEFTATLFNIDEVPTWTTSPANVVLSGNDYVKILEVGDFDNAASEFVQVTANTSDFTDTVTLYKVSAGASSNTVAQVTLFNKNTSDSSAPTLPSGDLVYTFATNDISGTLNSWDTTMPGIDKGEYMWAVTATADSPNTTDIIPAASLSTAQIVGVGGIDGITVDVTPPAVTVETSASGVVTSYSGTGNEIYVYEGGTALNFTTAASLTVDGTWRVVSILDTNITADSSASDGGTYAVYGNASGMTSDTAEIRYYIQIRTLKGETTYRYAYQYLSKAKNGASAITVKVTNPNFSLPTNYLGEVSSYIGSNTYIEVYEGDTLLTYDTTPDGSDWEFNGTSVHPTGAISVGSTSGSGTRGIVGVHGTMDDNEDSAIITYSITGKRSDDSTFNTTATQAISKAVAGTDAVDGLNSAVVTLFNSNTSESTPPSDPTGGPAIYTFATKALSNVTLNGWTQDASDLTLGAGRYLWVIRATASSNEATDNIPVSEFSDASLESIGGIDGTSVAVVTLYKKHTSGASAPSDITVDNYIYTFSTGVLTNDTPASLPINGWDQEYPTDLIKGEYVWAIQATAASIEATDTIASTEFSAPVVIGSMALNGINAILSNEAHTLPAYSDGTISDYTGSGTTIKVYEGTDQLTFTTGIVTAGEYSISESATNITVDATPAGNGSTTATYGVASGMNADTASIEYTITGKDSDGNDFTIVKIQSFTRNRNSKSLKLTADGQTFKYDAVGAESPASQSITFTATGQNLENSTISWSTSPSVTLTGSGSTRTMDWSAFDGNEAVTVTATADGAEVSDSYTVYKVQNGLNGLSVVLTNDSHVFAANSNGKIQSADYAGSGTDVEVYVGGDAVLYDGVGTADNRFNVTASGTDITPGSKSDGGDHAVFAAASSFADSDDRASIDFTISGKGPTGESFSVNKTQTFTKAKKAKPVIDVQIARPNISIPADENGAVIGSLSANTQTEIRLFADGNELSYDTGGYIGVDSEYLIFADGTDCAPTSNYPTDLGTRANFQGLSAISATTANVRLKVEGDDFDGNYFEVYKDIYFTLTNQGTTGNTGTRGGGRWNIDVDPDASPNSPALAATRWAAHGPGVDAVESDQAWFFKGTEAAPTHQNVFIYTSGAWVQQTEFIDGNLLVSDTITASKLKIGDSSLADDGSGNLIVDTINTSSLQIDDLILDTDASGKLTIGDRSINPGRITSLSLSSSGETSNVRALTSTDRFYTTPNSHGLNNGDIIVFTDKSSGQTAITLGRPYYIVNKNTQDFQVSTSPGNSAVALTQAEFTTYAHKYVKLQGVHIGTDYWEDQIRVYQNDNSNYGLRVENDSSSGGAAYIQSNGGYTLQLVTETDSAGVRAIDAAHTNGGAAEVALSDTDGGYAFDARVGGYKDTGGGGYNSFTGTHDAILAKNSNVLLGDIVIDYQLVEKNLMDTVTIVRQTNKKEDKAVVGVLSQVKDVWHSIAAFRESTITAEDYSEEYNLVRINAIGEGCINVCGENGNIETGDLIVSSSTEGKGMKQNDDIIRNITVAKSRETITFSNPQEIKQIACIYLCG